MIFTTIKNPGRSLAFLAGAFAGSQVPYFPKSYQTYLKIGKDQSEMLNEKYKEILKKRNSEEIRELQREEVENLKSLDSKLTSLENSSLPEKLGTIALDPRGAWGTIKHYNPGFDMSSLQETAGYGLAFGLLSLAAYEFIIRRPIKKMFSRKNKSAAGNLK